MKKNLLNALYSKYIEDNTFSIIKILGIKIKRRMRNNNKIYLINPKTNSRHEVKKIKGVEFDFRGCNSTIEIGCNPMPIFKNCKFVCGHNSKIKIGSSKHKQTLHVSFLADNSTLCIGENLSAYGVGIASNEEPDLTIKIGDDCMFSSDILIRATDAHTIYNNTTKEILNIPKETLEIGDHVWICHKATILKEAKIPNNSIVGNSALVTKRFHQNNIIIAGIPAKKIKEDVNWDRDNTHKFAQ